MVLRKTMRGLKGLAALGAGFGLVAVLMPACWYNDITIGDDCGPHVTDECCPCPVPEACPDGPKPVPAHCFPDAGADGDADATTSLCVGGTCVPSAPQGWQLVAFWSDWNSEPPPCPEEASLLLFEGSPAPPSITCGKCLCDKPEGACNVPTTWTISSAACADPGAGVNTNFDAPVDWDGTCNADVSIATGVQCGGTPCVRSVVISPPEIVESPCLAHSDVPELPIPKLWAGGPETAPGLVCKSGGAPASCAGGGKVCAPVPGGFKACLFREGEQVCPAGWDDRHLLYSDIVDERTCSDCSCGEPTGGTCEVLASLWGTATCDQLRGTFDVWSTMSPPCHDLMPGVALSGKTIDMIDYQPGSCAPIGGEVVGDLLLDGAATVCCYTPTV